ncbi:MAG: phosphatidate cytidylyltransferase [Muribaculaceae bacterium]|nr:phosphatidate cytidylyltransferase [Muribaculaceae bacterium]
MSNMLVRSLSGLVYIVIIVGAIMLGQAAFLGLTLLFAVLATIEFDHLCQNQEHNRYLTSTLDAVGSILLVTSCGLAATSIRMSLPFAICYVLWVLVRLTTGLYLHHTNQIEALSRSMMSQLYIAMPLGVLNFLYAYTPAIVLLMFVMIWLNDTGAYLVGSSMGRTRLFERISPKKSWEGFWGGLAFAAIAGFLASRFVSEIGGVAPTGVWAAYGVVVGVVATLGDLVESLIKRTLNVKDSGRLIPGHGGILDRIDSLLFVAPASVVFVFGLRLLSGLF